MQLTTEQRIKRAHIQLMKHPETALYSGVFMLGTTDVADEVSTAYTDGVNKRYGRAFSDALSEAELNALVMHENLHVAFRHLLHNKDLFDENPRLANVAADYVVNDIIVSLKDKNLCKLPPGALVDPRYHNMNMREIYKKLKEDCKKPKDKGDKPKGKPEDNGEQGQGQPVPGNGDGNDNGEDDPFKDYKFDDHDHQTKAPVTAEEAKELDTQIDRALREGALLAGRMGAKIPRSIGELLEPKTRWQDELRDFMCSTMSGKDEYTWRKFNRRQLPNDIYLPSVENEAVGEVVVAIDTSGSIGPQQINEFATELVSISESVSPERIRVLWWDTSVHGEQIFDGDSYGDIASMLRPLGGGGTHLSCVSEYINKKSIRAECVIVFTDGYVEDDVKWDIAAPTLWLVTQRKSWNPPAGRKVVFEQ